MMLWLEQRSHASAVTRQHCNFCSNGQVSNGQMHKHVALHPLSLPGCDAVAACPPGRYYHLLWCRLFCCSLAAYLRRSPPAYSWIASSRPSTSARRRTKVAFPSGLAKMSARLFSTAAALARKICLSNAPRAKLPQLPGGSLMDDESAKAAHGMACSAFALPPPSSLLPETPRAATLSAVSGPRPCSSRSSRATALSVLFILASPASPCPAFSREEAVSLGSPERVDHE
mmetsp:Transcript_64605/g.121068  ORF Transcript_64605/g.121068 Transcript_64605/m.121068 type:complete len:229 (+) Transcript_64605:125-811(+)